MMSKCNLPNKTWHKSYCMIIILIRPTCLLNFDENGCDHCNITKVPIWLELKQKNCIGREVAFDPGTQVYPETIKKVNEDFFE